MRHCQSKITIQCPRPGLEPGLLDQETSALSNNEVSKRPTFDFKLSVYSTYSFYKCGNTGVTAFTVF